MSAGPVSLNKIDEEMCKHFNVTCNPKLWYKNWYNIIGFSLATGSTFQSLREDFTINTNEWDGPEELLAITNWLDENFTKDAWVEIGKR